MALIIPGVEIRVIKELVPRPLGAAGVLGIVGQTERDRSGEAMFGVSSLSEFAEHYGEGSIYSLPEVVQAFANGVREVFVANIPQGSGSRSQKKIAIEGTGGPGEALFVARAAGIYGNKIAVQTTTKVGPDGHLVDVSVFVLSGDATTANPGRALETFRGLSSDPSSENIGFPW